MSPTRVMNPSVSIVCYKNKVLSNGESPLMLRIAKDGKRKYQSLGVSVDPLQWDFRKNKPNPTCPDGDYIHKIIFDQVAEAQQQKSITPLI